MLPNLLQRCVMQTEPVLDQAELDARLAALEDSIEAINTRIARLAIALKVSLDTPDHVQQVIDRSAMPKDVVSPFAPDATVTGQVPGDGEFALADRRTDANRRKAFEWEELRGLLILRFEIEKNYVEQLGLPATRQIVSFAENHQLREGFAAHADGLDVAQLMDDSRP